MDRRHLNLGVRRALLLACVAAVYTGEITAQDGTPAFEVVSVKSNDSFRRTDDPCSGPGTPLPMASDAVEPVPELRCEAGFSRAGHVGGRARKFSTLVRSLATWTDRVLQDRTELTGRFDWDLQWTPESSSPEIANVPNRLPLVTAVRDQLGFRLEAQRRPAEVFVIERAKRPQPD